MATETKTDAKPRPTPQDVLNDENNDMRTTPKMIREIVDGSAFLLEGFNNEVFVGKLVSKRDMDTIQPPYRLLQKGDKNHPNINPMEFTRFQGKDVVVRGPDAVIAYTFRETEQQLAQARADATVGRRVKRDAAPKPGQAVEHVKPNVAGLGPAEDDVSVSSRR